MTGTTKANDPIVKIVTVTSALASLGARLEAAQEKLGDFIARGYSTGTPATIYADGNATVIYTLVRYLDFDEEYENDDPEQASVSGDPAFEEALDQAENEGLTDAEAVRVAEDAVGPQDQQAEDGEPAAETEETTPKSRRNR